MKMKDLNMEMKYIGVCSLLSRIGYKLEEDGETKEIIEMALHDFLDTIEDGYNRFELIETNRGLILEPKR